jgi:hypothetical protein
MQTATIAAAGAASVGMAKADAHHPPSQLFLEFKARHAEFMAIFGPHEEDEAWYALEAERSDAVWDVARQIAARHPTSWHDVAEFADVLRNLLCDGHDIEDLDQHSSCEDMETGLIVAVLRMAQTGGVRSW